MLAKTRLRLVGVAVGVLLAVLAAVLLVRLNRPPLQARVIGLSRTELHRLLGEPAGRPFSGWDEVFVLGDDGSYFAIDNKWLGVRFDGDKVKQAGTFVD